MVPTVPLVGDTVRAADTLKPVPEVAELDEMVGVVEVHEPNSANRTRYDRDHAAYLDIYKQNRKIHRGLNGPRGARGRRHG